MQNYTKMNNYSEAWRSFQKGRYGWHAFGGSEPEQGIGTVYSNMLSLFF